MWVVGRLAGGLDGMACGGPWELVQAGLRAPWVEAEPTGEDGTVRGDLVYSPRKDGGGRDRRRVGTADPILSILSHPARCDRPSPSQN